MDKSKIPYRLKRIAHWNKVSTERENPKHFGTFYHDLLNDYYKFMVQDDLKIIELGCGHGDLLAHLNPSYGVGVDFSEKMIDTAMKKHPHLDFIHGDAHEININEKFDVIILSDIVNDLWDVQLLFNKIYNLSHPKTRVLLNYDSKMWRPPLYLAKILGLGANLLDQNWLDNHDVFNLLELENFEVVNHTPRILAPLKIKYVSTFLNKYLVQLIPFRFFALTNVVCARPIEKSSENTISDTLPSVSVIVAARNEAGHIEEILKRIPQFGRKVEVIFVEGNSTDNTYEVIEETIKLFPEKDCKLFKQPGKGKGDAVRLGFERATGDVLMILDADMTVPPEDLPRFYNALVSGKGDFINGVRLVYPMESEAMRFFNIIGNKFFSIAFSWLLGQKIKDTLCGTKVLFKNDYETLVKNRHYFGDFDPFGDFDLIFGAAKMNMKIAEMPIRYRDREYGDTNISRWRHGWLLLKMVAFAAKKIKFI